MIRSLECGIFYYSSLGSRDASSKKLEHNA